MSHRPPSAPQRALPTQPVPQRRKARRGGLWLASPLALVFEAAILGVLVAALVILVARERTLALPEAFAVRVETRASAALSAAGDRPVTVEIGTLALRIGRGGGLRLRAEEVSIGAAPAPAARPMAPPAASRDPAERQAAAREAPGAVRLTALEAALAPGALLRPARLPQSLSLEGAALDITRRSDGRLDFGVGTLRLQRRTPAQFIANLRRLLARPALAPLERVALGDLDLKVTDARTGQTWRIAGAALTLDRRDGSLSAALDARLKGRIALRATVPEDGPLDARFSALLDGVPAPALAAQFPALGWLGPLDAPVTGSLIGRLDPAGGAGPVDGTLEIGAGRLAPEAGRAVPFDRAQAYFSYRPEAQRLAFSSLAVEAPALSLVSSGHADLSDAGGGWPRAFTVQLALEDGAIRTGGAIPAPLVLSQGTLAAKLSLDPFELQIGQAGVDAAAADAPPTEDPPRLTARGRIAAEAGGWTASLDLAASPAAPDQVLALWPIASARGLRAWLTRALEDGRLTDAHAGLRLTPGARPQIAFSFGFERARFAPLATLPPIDGATGRASLGDRRFALTLESGTLTPPGGAPLDLAGSSFVVPDTTLRPSDGDLRLAVAGPVESVLSVLDEPPFRLLSRSGLAPDIAEGRAEATARILFPVAPRVTPQQVGFDVDATLTGLSSATLVPNRTLRADRLGLQADPTGLTIEGPAELDGVAFTGRFRQGFGPEAGPPAVEAQATLSEETVRAFGVALPQGMLSGAAPASLALTLPRGAPATLSLTSRLEGATLRLPGLAWTKPAAARGRLELAGRLGFRGAPPALERLSLEAPGLVAAGRLALAPGGGLDRLTLNTARLSPWFDGQLAIVGRGPGRPPAVEISGGRLDLAGAGFAPSVAGGGVSGGLSGGAGNGAAGPLPIRGRLDRVDIVGDVALTGATFDLTAGAGGLSGGLGGRINGGPEISGSLSPGQGGRPQLRVRAADAGAVLAAAGAFEEAQGGVLNATLSPSGTPGTWSGDLQVDEMRVTAAPGLAALLDTVSIVGLLERLNGPGLLFNTIRARFRLTPGAFELIEASAVGPSLGVSADGIYELAADRIDVQGVLSPIFFINAIGQALSREGEGLFGVNYAVRGSVSDPQVTVNPLSLLTPGAFREIFRTE